MPQWVNTSIWWHVYPLGFTGAPPDLPKSTSLPPTHRLTRLIEWLDYAIELGVNGLCLGPIFHSQSHGYDTIDYYTIDPRLGDEADFDKLLNAAHERGMRVVLDGVFNHVGTNHPWFQKALADPTAAPAQWFSLYPKEDRCDYDHFEGHTQLPTLNHRNIEVAKEITKIMTAWLARGIDGWRLDAAYAINPTFWQRVIPFVRSQFPEAFLFGEVIHGDYTAIVRKSGMDSVTQYELWKAIQSSINDHNFFELDWTLTRHNEFLESFTPVTFVGNHDVTRIATAIEDPDLLPHALAVLFAVGGIPMIYYGDEQAFAGTKYDRPGGDAEVRQPFPSAPDELAPFGWPTYHVHQELIALRRRHPWLVTAHTEPLELENSFYAFRTTDGTNALITILNLEPESRSFPLPGIGAREAGNAAVSGSTITLGPKSWAIFRA